MIRVASVASTIKAHTIAKTARILLKIAAFDSVSIGLRVSLLSSTKSGFSDSFSSVRFIVLVCLSILALSKFMGFYTMLSICWKSSCHRDLLRMYWKKANLCLYRTYAIKCSLILWPFFSWKSPILFKMRIFWPSKSFSGISDSKMSKNWRL